MKFILMLFIGIWTLTLNAQTNRKETVEFSRIGELSYDQLNSSGAKKLIFITDEKEAEKMAELDIKNGNPFLLLMGGIAPTIIATDPQFEKKYGIYFYEFGCSGPENDIIIAYNKIVFEHLNSTKGKTWIKEVRDDVIGFKEWKRNYKRKN
ncbi:FEKKY domain-containing protein [Mesonia mobilis]|uniref:Uncharacterized protein n=1 Tax=Mesonia mobilis TaxID=369791 RepID=A0ABQ3C1X1_9FLAO|nr:hypothetical protein [Mesonia mobilis]MBQ0739697.1 hypothetical protein [Aquimarina celericrescens]GGZ64868.1 hypothetical protein GCM10008088_27920 [Mesonia mobilis]